MLTCKACGKPNDESGDELCGVCLGSIANYNADLENDEETEEIEDNDLYIMYLNMFDDEFTDTVST